MEEKSIAQEVRRVLRHLDDALYLENLGLARQVGAVIDSPDLTRGQALQRTVRLVIASLEPNGANHPSDVDPSTFQVLYQYAVARKTVIAIAEELGISERKAYYALERASDAVATILGDLMEDPVRGVAPAPATAPDSTAVARVRRELSRLANTQAQDVELRRLLEEVVRGLVPLAESCGVQVALHTECGPLRVAAKRVLLRQAYLNLLSYAIENSQDRLVDITLAERNDRIHVEITTQLPDATNVSPEGGPLAVATEIIEALGLGWERTPNEDGRTTVVVHLDRAQQKVVLVVDDHEGVIALMRRYLRNQPYVVHGASDAEEAARLVAEVQPDVIILDIMLPYQDGWEVLESIRSSRTACQKPVIVCSIINDPQLATAMGAAAFLLKPVDRAGLLQALETVLSPET